jgi:hypothetical protein
MILIATRHAGPTTCKPRDKQTRFSTWNKDKGSLTTKMSQIQIQIMACHWIITYQTKVLTTWFLNLPLDESIDNKKHKVWSLNPKPHEAHLEEQKARNAQECHLEERKIRKANKSTKTTNQEKWQRRAKKN